MKPLAAATFLFGYGLYRFYKYNEHNKNYQISHSETLAKIEKINRESFQKHQANMKIINRMIDELNPPLK